jgi:hypothetical protein
LQRFLIFILKESGLPAENNVIYWAWQRKGSDYNPLSRQGNSARRHRTTKRQKITPDRAFIARFFGAASAYFLSMLKRR